MNTENFKKIAEEIFETWTRNPSLPIVVPDDPENYNDDFDVCGIGYRNTDENKEKFADRYDPCEWGVAAPSDFENFDRNLFIECCTLFLEKFYEQLYCERHVSSQE